MFRMIFLLLSFALLQSTMTTANPCPCEVIVSEQLTNEPSTAMLESTADDFNEKKFWENYFERLPLETSSELFPSVGHRQEKNFDLSAQRNKRPSWAAVGKRAMSYMNKRPSWAQVG